MRKSLPALAAALAIAIYFFVHTKDALHSYFSPDDFMNLYRAWGNPLSGLIKANIFFFESTRYFRPMGLAWYRSIFDIWGFNPVAFHAVNLAIICVNIWLTYAVARRLAGSRESGALAALLFSVHASMALIYFDTAFIYDVIVYFFYFTIFLIYTRIRSQDRPLRWTETAGCAALFICAVNTKEMALSLPFFLFVYEFYYRGLPPLSLEKYRRWIRNEGRTILVTGAIAAAVVIGRARGGDTMLNNPAFKLTFTWSQLMATSENFLDELFLMRHPPSAVFVVSLWAILFTVAWLSGSRALKFAWLFLMLSPIPVAFVIPRGAPQYYVPYFGWVLYAGAGLTQLTRRLFREAPELAHRMRAIALFSVVMALMISVNAQMRWSRWPSVALEGEELRSIDAQLHQLRPALKHGAHIIFLNDPVDDRWRLTALMRLSYHDNDLQVDQVRYMPAAPTPQQIASYDALFDYRRGRFYTTPVAQLAHPEPTIIYEWGRPSIYHCDWTRVTSTSPAHPGEQVISLASDLGATIPAVDPGAPFPKSPSFQVVAPVDVRVDGRPAQVILKIGWPETIDKYRLDFRIPSETSPGSRSIEIECRNVKGPLTPIDVK